MDALTMLQADPGGWLSPTVILGLVASVLALVGVVWTNRRVNAAQARNLDAGTATTLSRRLSELEVALDDERSARREVEAELAAVKVLLCDYRNGTQLLVEQLQANGYVPAWLPPGMRGM